MKNSTASVMRSQLEFERSARELVATGLRRGWIRHGSESLVMRQAIEKFKALGMIGVQNTTRGKAKQDERFSGIRHGR